MVRNMSGIASALDWMIANPTFGVPVYLLCHFVMQSILYRMWRASLSLVEAVQLSAFNRFCIWAQLFVVWTPLALFGVVILIHALQTR
jgi:hypothetical protein